MNDLNSLAAQAVQAALSSQHNLSLQLNQQILDTDPDNIAALNRLGQNYLSLNQPEKAKKCYRQALNLDPYNLIAKKNLQRLHNRGDIDSPTMPDEPCCYDFIEIPGKTQNTNLVKLADKKTLCQLKIGQMVQLVYKKRVVRVYHCQCYVGSLPDDISLRLLPLAANGNKYQAYVSSIQNNRISVFLRECYQSEKNQNLVSFAHTRHNSAYPTTIAMDIIS